MSGIIIRMANPTTKNLDVVMIVEEDDIEEGTESIPTPVIIPESSESGKLLYAWALREKKSLPFTPQVFSQPGGVQSALDEALTTAVRAQGKMYNRSYNEKSACRLLGMTLLIPNEDIHDPSNQQGVA
ncbi:MAG: hypothetical protein Q7S63_00515 [bacterium]|nr:hypothetical protein [bacterium]